MIDEEHLSICQRLLQSTFSLISPDDLISARRVLIKELASITKAERIRLCLINTETHIMEMTEEWVDNDDKSLFQDWKTASIQELNWLVSCLRNNQLLEIPNLADIKEEHPAEFDWFSRQGINKTLVIPLPIKRKIGGCLLIDEYQLELETPIANALNQVGIALGKALSPASKVEHLSELKHDDTMFQLIFEQSRIGVMVLSPEKEILAVNQKILKIFSKPHDYFDSKQLDELEELFPKGELNVLRRNISLSQMGRNDETEEITISDAEGTTRHLEVGCIKLMKQNHYYGDALVIDDITFRKGMELSAQESETKLRRVLESIKEGITLSDDQGYFEIFNPEMEQLTGYSREEANKAHNFIELIHPHIDAQSAAKSRLENFQVGDNRQSEIEVQSKDGSTKHVTVATTVIHSDNKKYFLSAFHDVTLQKQFQLELEARNQKLEKLTEELNQTASQLRDARDHLEDKVVEKTKELREKVDEVENLARFPSEDPYPVLRITAEGELLYANSASQALLDKWGTTIGQSVPEGWKDIVVQSYQQNSRRFHEVELLGQFISFVLVPVKSAGYVNMYGRDISKEKEIDRMKNQFISMVSHQIRTPITSVRWYSEMLLKGKNENALNDKQIKITNTIHDTVISLTELINDLLSISRMESGKIDYKAEKGAITDLVDSIVAELQPQADQKQIELVKNIGEIEVFGFDPKLIREVYRNLLSNAIKYTPEKGVVKVDVSVQDKMVVSSISDTGIGIPTEARKDIFKRFYRAQNAVDQEYEGTGLGLSVAKMIVEKAGGKIWFESSPGKGTTFYFSIPLQIML